MKIPRRQPEPKPAEPTIWDQLSDFINDPKTWEPAPEHSHDIGDAGHSHGSHSYGMEWIREQLKDCDCGYCKQYR